MLLEEALTSQIIAAAIEVQKHLGPGLLESAYAKEFSLRGLPFEVEKPLPVEYGGARLDCGYRMDFVVAGKVVLELKALESLLQVHEAQLLTYLKLSRLRIGLLINFNVALLKDGIRRLIL